MFISQVCASLAARTQFTRTGISPPHSRPLESGEFMPVRSKCRKGSEVSLSRVPSQWCGSGDARGALVLIGGEISPGVWRNEIEHYLDAQLTSVCGACTWVDKRGGTHAYRFRCLSVYLGRYRGLLPCEIPGFGWVSGRTRRIAAVCEVVLRALLARRRPCVAIAPGT